MKMLTAYGCVVAISLSHSDHAIAVTSKFWYFMLLALLRPHELDNDILSMLYLFICTKGSAMQYYDMFYVKLNILVLLFVTNQSRTY